MYDMNNIHDNDVYIIYWSNLLHDILNISKTNKILILVITLSCMDILKTSFLLLSGCSSMVVIRRLTSKIEIQKMIWCYGKLKR